jgi:uncharacterized protein involved in exopolysaccharide biosynthesis
LTASLISSESSRAFRGLSIVSAVSAILRRRRIVIAVTALTAIAVATMTLLRARTYTARTSFTPQATRSPLGALGGIAAQFGMSAAATDGNQSPAFYGELLHTRTVLEPLVGMPVSFTWKGRNVSGTYVDVAGPKVADPTLKFEGAVRRLRRDMDVTVAPRTGIVQLAVTTPYPMLSALIADSALGQINRFNLATRRSQAAAQRAFLDQRMATVSAELEAAENEVRDFGMRNRSGVNNAPDLQIRRERLNRTVTMRSEVYATLAQSLEQAKLDEIRDTPLITVIERPRVPVIPDPRGLITFTAIAAIVGLAIGAVLAIVVETISANRHDHPEEFSEISSELAAVKADLRRILWPFGRSKRGV